MPVVLGSNVTEIPFTGRYFGDLASTPVDSPEEILRRSLRDQGYVFLRGALCSASVRRLRAAYLAHFPASMFKPGTARDEGIFSGTYPDELPPHGTPGHPAHAFVRSVEFRTFVAAPRLQALAQALLGGPALRLCRTPLRHFVRGSGVASRAHIDHTYLNGGSSELITFWIPIGDCPLVAGGLIYLENSIGVDLDDLREALPIDRAHDTRALTHDLRALADRTRKRWLHADFAAGDVIVHSPFIVHASINAQVDMMRISIDVRFVRTGAAVDPRWREDWSADDGH